MQQNERDYLNTLKVRLTEYVSREDLDDILADYAEHFSIGKSEGRSEEDLCRALGSPEDVAKEIRATYLVKKAEQACSAGNIWHAVTATLGLGLFNLAVVLIPFILLIVLLTIIFVAGVFLVIVGPILLLAAVMQLLGVSISAPWGTSPLVGILTSIALSVAGVFMVVVDLHLARFFYGLAIRYMKWNIQVIRGGEPPVRGEPAGKNTLIRKGSETALDLQMRFGTGEITIGESTDEQILLNLAQEGVASSAPYDYSTSLIGTKRTVWLHGRHSFASCWNADKAGYTWDIRLNREVPVAIDLRNHAGKTRLDLRELNISSLRIKNGAGETSIDLTGYHGGNFDATIKNGVGSLIVRVPKESNMRIQIQRGLGDTDVRGLLVEGDTYVTHTDHPGAPQITCRIKQGIGSISLEAV
jgi:uncharacterized membrane protein